MKRAAFFVEGQTEAIFLKRLLQEMAGDHNIIFHEEKKHAGIYLLQSTTAPTTERYEALIVDCSNDDQVLSSILDRYSDLVTAGYDLIIGIRDLYPLPAAALAAVQAAIQPIIPNTPTPVIMTIAVQEVEAWFLQEESHLSRIDPRLTATAIHAATGYNINSDLAEGVGHPATLLHEIYQIAGLAYRKNRRQVQRTVSAIDYSRLYIERRPLMPSIDPLLSGIERFLLI